jgi:outer membrane receptor protein involved in Fe transport
MNNKPTPFGHFVQKRVRHAVTRRLLLAGLLSVALLYSSHAQTYSLDEPVTLALSETNAMEVLDKLDNQTHFSFTYSKAAFKTIAIEKVEWKTIPLHKALEELKKRYQLEYQVFNSAISFRRGTVTIMPAMKDTTRARQNKSKVTGKIMDEEDRRPVPGATVHIGANDLVSNEEGIFTLMLPRGRYKAVISAIGYNSRQLPELIVANDTSFTMEVALTRDKGQLGAVVVKADRVITSTDKILVNEIKNASGIVSGISSEQITISVDRSASEVARRISGVTLQNGFISIRGMTPRYNPVFLNNAFLPSTDPNKRAFNFDLLPSSVIDRILVYKSAAPELPADFAGGVVKVYTKKSVPVRRLELSVNAQYKSGNKFFDNHTQATGGKYDWLGFDDGTRATPVNLPRNPYGQLILPDINSTPNSYTQSNEVITNALLARSLRSWNLQQTYHPVDLQADATYYNYANIGSMKLNSVTVGRYENQRSYFWSDVARNANMYVEKEFPKDGSPLTRRPHYSYRLSYDSVYSSQVRLAAMQHFSLAINADHEITAMGLFNRNTKDVLQINTLKEWYSESASSLFPRRFENAYNTQQLYMGMIGGTHKMRDGKHLVEWSGSYSNAISKDPNQFSNTFDVDDASIIGDRHSFGRLNITDSTTWKFMTGTNRNTVIGRFTDGEGTEKRWQGNIDYTLKPLRKWDDLKIRAGSYFESRRKDYVTTTLSFRDYPAMAFSKDPWTNLGNDLRSLLAASGHPMHTAIQSVGVGLAQTDGYQASFDNAAGYLAMNIPVRFQSPFHAGKEMRLEVYGGVRLEYSKRRVFTTTGEEILLETRRLPGGGTEIVGEAPPAEQHFWLPSVSATLHLSQAWQLRMSYGKTLNRPDLRELSPYLTYNPAEGATYIGRPTLRDARINNYDLRLEWYPAEGEAISAGVYHKNMKDPIEETMSLTNTGIPGYTHSNQPFSRIYGAELEVRKKLGFLGGALFQHMGIIINACYNLTEASNEMRYEGISKTNYYPGGTIRPFTGAAPWILNAGLFYDNKTSGSRFSLQYNLFCDRMIFNTSGVKVADLEPWVFERSRHLLDLSLLQRIHRRISIRVAAQNILNAAIRQYVDGDFNKKFNEEPTLFTWDLNLNNGTQSDKYIQGDYYIRNYRPGVYYTLGFQFNL